MKYMEPEQIVALDGQDMVIDPNETDEAVAQRMRLLRRTVRPGMTIKEYAERFLGVGYSRYLNVEHGSPLGKDLAGVIRKKVHGITTDWMFYGDTRGVHLDLLRDISERAELDAGKGNTEANG